MIATEWQKSVRGFIELTAAELGWERSNGIEKGVNEIGRGTTGEVVLRIDLRYFRPVEVETR